MSVLSALNNIYAQREPERQWARAVGIMKDMSEMEIATSWKTFSAQIDTHNVADAIITHSQYKSIFDGVLSEAITGRQQFIETDNTKRSTPNTEGVEQLLKKYSELVEEQEFRAARLFAMYAEPSGSDPTHQAYDTPEYIRRSDERPPNTAPGKVNSDQREVGKNKNTIEKIEEIKELMNKQMTDTERQFKEIKQTILRILALQNTDGVERIESTAHTDKQFQNIVDILNTLQGSFSTLDQRITSMESAIAASTKAGERTVDTLNEYKDSMETLNTKITNMESKLPEGIKDDLKTIQDKMASVQLNIGQINENNAKTAVRTEEIALMMKSTDFQLEIQREKLAIHLQDLIDEIHQINHDAETIHSEYDQGLNELQTRIKQKMETTEAAVQAAIDDVFEDIPSNDELNAAKDTVKERTGTKFEEAAASISDVFENMRGLDQGTENSETTDSDEDDPGHSPAADDISIEQNTRKGRATYSLSNKQQKKLQRERELKELERRWGKHDPYLQNKRQRMQQKEAARLQNKNNRNKINKPILPASAPSPPASP